MVEARHSVDSPAAVWGHQVAIGVGNQSTGRFPFQFFTDFGWRCLGGREESHLRVLAAVVDCSRTPPVAETNFAPTRWVIERYIRELVELSDTLPFPYQSIPICNRIQERTHDIATRVAS